MKWTTSALPSEPWWVQLRLGRSFALPEIGFEMVSQRSTARQGQHRPLVANLSWRVITRHVIAIGCGQQIGNAQFAFVHQGQKLAIG